MSTTSPRAKWADTAPSTGLTGRQRAALAASLDGLDLSADDERLIDWLATWDQPTTARLASLLSRAMSYSVPDPARYLEAPRG